MFKAQIYFGFVLRFSYCIVLPSLLQVRPIDIRRHRWNGS